MCHTIGWGLDDLAITVENATAIQTETTYPEHIFVMINTFAVSLFAGHQAVDLDLAAGSGLALAPFRFAAWSAVST